MGKGRERKKINLVVQFCSYPTRNRKFQKKRQKNSKKLEKYHYGSISSQNRLKEDEKGRKYKLSFGSVPTRRGKENAKKKAKKLKKLKNTIMASFKVRIGWKRPRMKENKYFRSVSFLPNK